MLTLGAYEKARKYMEARSLPQNKDVHGPCITISRQTGAGADIIGNKIASHFEKYHSNVASHWVVFDKNLIDKVIEDHDLPHTLRDLLDEKEHSNIEKAITDLLGIQSMWSLMHKIVDTILKIGQLGNSVIIGRGANIITMKLNNALHVRLIANKEDRVKHASDVYELTKREAEIFIERMDYSRKRFIKTNFHKDIEDPSLYHMVLNTSFLGYDQCADIIINIVNRKFHHLLNVFDYQS